MIKFSKVLCLFLLLAGLTAPQACEAQGGCFNVLPSINVVPEAACNPDSCCPLTHDHYCKTHDVYYCGCKCKVRLGQKFTYFDLEDIHNQRWISTHLVGRPTIILTGNRHKRPQIMKWAENFRHEFLDTGLCNVLWVNNLSKSRYHNVRETVYSQWRSFNAPIPVLCDWEGVIGKSLKVDYEIPNIIVLDSHGKLMMHEMHFYNPNIYKSISTCIHHLCSQPNPCCEPAPKVCSIPSSCVPILPPCGSKCDSY